MLLLINRAGITAASCQNPTLMHRHGRQMAMQFVLGHCRAGGPPREGVVPGVATGAGGAPELGAGALAGAGAAALPKLKPPKPPPAEAGAGVGAAAEAAGVAAGADPNEKPPPIAGWEAATTGVKLISSGAQKKLKS